MGLDDRLAYFLLGGFIGFVLGCITTKLCEKSGGDLKGVENTMRKRHDERGAITLPSFKDVALFLVVLLTLYAAINSQLASNKSNDVSASIIEIQSNNKQNLDCTTQVVFDAVKALNERTTYSGAQADANIDLVQAQFDLLIKGRDPNLTKAEGQKLLDGYVDQVKKFLKVVKKNRAQIKLFPYPTVKDLTDCLSSKPDTG